MANQEPLSDDDDYISDSIDTDDEDDFQYESKKVIEDFDYECFSIEDAEKFLNTKVEALCKELNINPAEARMLLHFNEWNFDDIVMQYNNSLEQLLINSHLQSGCLNQNCAISASAKCEVCTEERGLPLICTKRCNHYFCNECWDRNFQVQIDNRFSTRMECMATNCNVIIPEDFVEMYLTSGHHRKKYQQNCFNDYVESHPELQLCPGPRGANTDCNIIIYAKQKIPKRVICSQCKSSFCFSCRKDYHAPTQCDIIRKWWTKCADDSETANYINANTKDCPKCHVVIEKNGGCNHVHCCQCQHDFCWMCLLEWKVHGSEYYECVRFKENPNIVSENQAIAREALEKYLFYFARYENHKKSLKLEMELRTTIQEQIDERIKEKQGTWIDWQYLLSAFDRLKTCRYTLQYTYPYAYYLDKSDKKELYEGWQAQLELEVENLSWKIQHAEKEEQVSLENQMDVAEKRRETLLRDFFET